MKLNAVSGIMLILLLIGMLTMTFNIQPVKASGTIYIRADGSIDPPTANITTVYNTSYTFIGNINESIVVERDNIVVDGAGYSVEGTGSGRGIDLTGRINVTIKNMEIIAFQYGIYLYGASNSSISGNKIIDNGIGVWLEDSSSNSISGNNVTKCGLFGIVLYSSSSNNTLSGNSIANNGIGIWLSESSNNTLSGNMMDGNLVNFGGVSGYELSHFMHSIDVSNLVDGKPVYYLINQKDLVINPATHPQVGYLALINCANVTVEDLTLTDNAEGLLLAYSNNSRIIDNTITNNHHGIGLFMSFNNTLSGNIITNNFADGFYLERSSDNTVSGNTITNSWWGIQLYGSSNNFIYHNNFLNNTIQVHTEDSVNVWDDGYPSGGNYWSDHNPPDIYSGSYQNETGRDKIGDIPYVIDENNTDRYPLIYPYGYVPSLDLNDDGKITITDIVIIALAFGTEPGDPEWNPMADLNQDGRITITDIVRIALHFGETW